MGYSIELFLDLKINTEFICQICHDVIKDPIMAESCQHIFCYVCIKNWLKSSTICPYDRQPIAKIIIAPSPAYLNNYHRLSLKCNLIGCSAITSLGQLQSHLNSCPFNPTAIRPCAHNCGASIAMADVPSHSCIAYLKAELAKKTKAHQLEKKGLIEANEELKRQILERNNQIRQLSTNGEQQLNNDLLDSDSDSSTDFIHSTDSEPEHAAITREVLRPRPRNPRARTDYMAWLQ